MQVLFIDVPAFKPALDDVEERLRTLRPDITVIRRPPSVLLDDEALKRADVILGTRALPVDLTLLRKAASLRAVVSLGIGTEFVDISAASERGVLVAYGASDENIESVAEATVLLMLSVLYDLRGAEAVCREGAPRSARRTPVMLRGLSIGLLGFGPIARAVARRLANWDVELLVHARRVSPMDGLTSVSLEELLRRSDVLSIHMALTPTTEKLLGHDQLRCMKPNAVLINTARGEIVDEGALIEALAEGRISGAGLDVFETEPPLPTNPLLRSSRTVVTPHILAQTRQAMEATPRVATENLVRLADGRVPLYVRNPEIAPTWSSRWQQTPVMGGSARP